MLPSHLLPQSRFNPLCAREEFHVMLMQVRSAVFFLLPTLLLVGLPTRVLANLHEILPSQYRFLPVEWRSFYPCMAFQVRSGFRFFVNSLD